jgi:copper chaperone CopZ
MKSTFKFGMIAGVAAALLTLSITFGMAGSPAPTIGTAGETVLQVSNLSCGACLKHIETELRKDKGMLGMTSDLATGMITVKHTADLTPERLAAMVTAVGYPAKVASAGSAADQTGTAVTSGCKGCVLKDSGTKNCNAKNCDTKNCDKKNCDVKNCDAKNCATKNCASKGDAKKGCDKKGCKLPPAQEKS